MLLCWAESGEWVGAGLLEGSLWEADAGTEVHTGAKLRGAAAHREVVQSVRAEPRKDHCGESWVGVGPEVVMIQPDLKGPVIRGQKQSDTPRARESL